MQWFRMYVEAMDDEKLKLLAFEDRWHYVVILCMKRKGMLDVEEAESLRDRKVGVKLGLGANERDEVRRRLLEVNLIDTHWQPVGWAKRQFVSDADPTAGERKKKQRDKERHANVTRDVTDESRTSHTAQSQIQSTESDIRLLTSSPSTQRKWSSLSSEQTKTDLIIGSEEKNRAQLGALASSIAKGKRVSS